MVLDIVRNRIVLFSDGTSLGDFVRFDKRIESDFLISFDIQDIYRLYRIVFVFLHYRRLYDFCFACAESSGFYRSRTQVLPADGACKSPGLVLLVA